VYGESGEGHQWTTGGVRGGGRVNIGREDVEDFLDGPGRWGREAVGGGFRSEFVRE
jgi:hypothetical protein